MNKVVIVVGAGKDKDGVPLSAGDVDVVVSTGRDYLLRIAPGVTVTRGQGSWVDPRGVTVEEDVIRFESVGQFTREQARTIAGRIRFLGRQECVTFEFTAGIDFELV